MHSNIVENLFAKLIKRRKPSLLTASKQEIEAVMRQIGVEENDLFVFHPEDL